MLSLRFDEDGDAMVRRNREASPSEDAVLSEVHLECAHSGGPAVTVFHTMAGEPLISLRHALATPLSHVGLQVGSSRLLRHVLMVLA